MIKTVLKIDGMMCGMCEAHICDAIRNAVSIGGDSDTIAAITGSIAEAAYGIPDWIKKKAYSYLDEPLKDVLRRWRKFVPHQDPG